jgi:DNA-binding winged helix-turn-helix (wHTH) protein
MVYEFEDFEVDESLFELRRRGQPVQTQPKVLALILYLAANRDRVVSTKELFHALWPDQVVGETSLTKAIRGARRALGDSAACQAMVRTVRGRGYRFAALVRLRGAQASTVDSHNGHAPAWAEAPSPSDDAHRVLRCRCEQLSPTCRTALAVAALIGYEFSLDLLSKATSMPEENLLAVLDEAIAQGFVRRHFGTRKWFAFPERPIRDAICEGLSDAELARLDHQVARAVETQCGPQRTLEVS